MSTLIAFLYPEEKIADNVLEAVEKLAREGHIDIEDACAITKNSKGQIHFNQEINLSFIGAVSGLVLGTILGWIVWLPYLGIPGALLGALSGKISDRGIKDQDMKDLSHEMPPESSALFLLLRNRNMETVVQDLAPYGGRIFHTSLSKAQELALEEKLQQMRTRKEPEIERSPEMHD
ncbi:MAG: DUF1269 domain-containing protein [Pseudobdellovibrionaceae bacterium]